MKTILLIRHAKSSWDKPGQEDRDRSLNERGKKDAPLMAKRLKEKKIEIDVFYSSPAKRARSTANRFMKEYDVDKNKMLTSDLLYAAGIEEFNEALEKLSDKYDNIAVFSHNPGITSFANSLTTTRIDDMPTSAIFAVKIEIDKWKNFRTSEKEFWFFDFPKAEI
jgi:phosphohistidine phosphatase